MRRLVFALLLVTSACKDGCAHKDEAVDVDAGAPKRWANVHVEVERPGAPAFVIDSPLLERNLPDKVDPHWMAWRLRKIVPSWAAADAVDVVDDEGFRSPLLRAGEAPGDTEPMLLVGADGETRAVRVAPNEPLTAHKGDTRKDAGRVRHVAKIVFLGADAGVAGPAISVKVVVAGKESTWTRAELSKVPPIVLMSKDGDGERDAWSLRELATTLVGPNAVVLEGVGEDGKTMKVDATKWKESGIIPVLRSNRRGRLKLVWLDAKTHEEDKDEEQLRGVTELRLR